MALPQKPTAFNPWPTSSQSQLKKIHIINIYLVCYITPLPRTTNCHLAITELTNVRCFAKVSHEKKVQSQTEAAIMMTITAAITVMMATRILQWKQVRLKISHYFFGVKFFFWNQITNGHLRKHSFIVPASVLWMVHIPASIPLNYAFFW